MSRWVPRRDADGRWWFYSVNVPPSLIIFVLAALAMALVLVLF